MTGDARGEAEQIVQVVRETSSLASCSDVVAALAAAIEWQDSRWCQGVRSVEAAERLRNASNGLHEALSALRAHPVSFPGPSLQEQVGVLQDDLAGTFWVEPPRIPLPTEAPLDSDAIERVRRAMVAAAYEQVAKEADAHGTEGRT